MQLVSDAQRRHAEQLQQDGLLKEPHPSCRWRPFRGGRNGINDFTYVARGDISCATSPTPSIRTPPGGRGERATVKEWLEMSAGQFNRSTPARPRCSGFSERELPTYNFDVIDGVNYEVDITQPARYSKDGVQVSDGQRISGLTFQRPAQRPGPEVLRGDQQLPRQRRRPLPRASTATLSMKIPLPRRGRSSPSTRRPSRGPGWLQPGGQQHRHMKALPPTWTCASTSPTDGPRPRRGGSVVPVPCRWI